MSQNGRVFQNYQERGTAEPKPPINLELDIGMAGADGACLVLVDPATGACLGGVSSIEPLQTSEMFPGVVEVRLTVRAKVRTPLHLRALEEQADRRCNLAPAAPDAADRIARTLEDARRIQERMSEDAEKITEALRRLTAGKPATV